MSPTYRLFYYGPSGFALGKSISPQGWYYFNPKTKSWQERCGDCWRKRTEAVLKAASAELNNKIFEIEFIPQ